MSEVFGDCTIYNNMYLPGLVTICGIVVDKSRENGFW